jgi:hypothetical protein
MSESAANADAFFREVAEHGQVWTIRDAEGIPAPVNRDGQRAMPFWSLASRAQKVIATAGAYREFAPEAVPLDAWRERWLPGLARDAVLVGLNWSGEHATGFDLSPEDALARLDAVGR